MILAHTVTGASGYMVGPEAFSYEELVGLIMEKTSASRRPLRVSPALTMLGAKLTGALVGDIALSRDEMF